jgi:hypothetical protein
VNSVAVRDQPDLFSTIDENGNLFVWSLETLQTVRKLIPQNMGQFKIQ